MVNLKRTILDGAYDLHLLLWNVTFKRSVYFWQPTIIPSKVGASVIWLEKAICRVAKYTCFVDLLCSIVVAKQIPIGFYNDYLVSTDILGALEDFQGVLVVSDKADLRFSV